MKLDFLWTDYCLFFLLFISVVGIIYGLKKIPIRRAFQHIFKRPMAMCSAIVLLCFISIGLLDSVHFKKVIAVNGKQHYSTQLYSLLDVFLAPLDTQQEKTYSAPFSLHAYTKETVIVDGHTQQVYPRLNYVPSKIKTASERNKNVALLTLRSLIKQTINFGLLFSSFVFIMAYTQGRSWKSLLMRAWQQYNYRVMILTSLLCVLLIGISFDLSRSYHILGTGKIGQDIFYYTIKSIRTGLIIGTLTTLFMLPLALALGLAAGFFGGFIDDVIQYIYTTLSSIPGVLLIAASVLSIQLYISTHQEAFPTLAMRADARLLALCLILGVTSWTSLCRMLRAETLKLREIDYIQAAHALGSSQLSILVRHLLPNVMHIVLIAVVLDFSFLVLAEAVLSYVGVGVSPMTISWGNMINGARLELARTPIVWWPMASAFSLMFCLVLASNLFADAVRDAFDPHNAER